MPKKEAKNEEEKNRREDVKAILEGVRNRKNKVAFLKKFFFLRSKKFTALLVTFGLFLTTSVYLFWGLPLPTRLTSEQYNPVSTQILDRNGKLIYELFEEKRRTPVELGELPKHVAQATIAIEDKDFYKHPGFSVTGIARAFYKNVGQQDLQGGSTITQQLVKTTLLTPERTLKRKIRELALTLVVELLYSKDQILEMYLNNVPYGGTAWGIESAAQNYFGKSAKDLTLAEASILAGLPQAPTKYSPFGVNPDLAKKRQEQVLKRMFEDGYITEEESKEAGNKELTFVKQTSLKAPHFALLVKEQLVEKYGEYLIERGGLRVRTTLDLDIQEFAQETVATEIERLQRANVRNGAALVILPKTGEVVAMVGSKDYFAEDEDGKVNITLRLRQPGSAIKPLNYALGLLNGNITAATPFADVPTCFNVGGQESYCPVNYDNTFHGLVQTRFVLGNSYNIPAVRTLALNGLSEFVDFAKRMGLITLSAPSNYGLSLTLGGGEVRMIDLATAFSVFANGGVKQEPVTILEVKDWKGNVIETTDVKEGDRIIPLGVAYIISHILLDNNARTSAFGSTSQLVVSGHPEVSVKTGTTNDRRDNWTVGYSPEVIVATWVGNNNNEPMSAVASGVTGASPIWNRVIRHALDRIEDGLVSPYNQTPEKHTHLWPLKPADVVGTNVCATTGTLPSGSEEDPGCPIRFEYFLEDNLPKPSQPLNQAVFVFKDRDMLASPNADPEQIEPREHQVVTDPLGTPVCLDCAIPQDWPVIVNVKNIIPPRREVRHILEE